MQKDGRSRAEAGQQQVACGLQRCSAGRGRHKGWFARVLRTRSIQARPTNFFPRWQLAPAAAHVTQAATAPGPQVPRTCALCCGPVTAGLIQGLHERLQIKEAIGLNG
jgi:hypothetical protein